MQLFGADGKIADKQGGLTGAIFQGTGLMLKQIIMACVAGLLAACQTSGGTTVGAEWAPNTRAASNVSVVGDDSFITAREW